MAARKLDTLPRVEVDSRAQWRSWLLENHRSSTGVWCVTNKKRPGAAHVSAQTVSEECLCFGWIDSLPRRLSDSQSMLLCTPRSPTSAWSKVNKDRLERLFGEGQVHASGLAAIAEAKASGRWSALDAVDALLVPDDLARALRANGPADQNFAAFPKSVKRGILEWISTAKKPETRLARVLQTASLAAKNERANQWPKTR